MHTELLLIRHGETAWNALGKFQGHTDVALNDTGLAQAHAAADAVARLHREQPFSGLISSDLQRAVQTAVPLAHVTGLHATVDTRLRERNYGVLEGLTREQMAAQHSHDFARLFEPRHAPPQGESLAQVFDRVQAALSDLAQTHRGQRILVVCHGGVLHMVWHIANQQWVDAAHSGHIRNASLNSIVHDGSRFSVRYWGDIAHLAPGATEEVQQL
ncbi:MAG: histidine phosphatase family protein [Burkholderiaceae bacterium]